MQLIDFSQVCVSSFFALGKVDDHDFDINLFRHIVFNVLGTLNFKFRNIYGEMLICCDGKNSWRKAIFPYYKMNRKDRKNDVKWQKLFQYINQIVNEMQEETNFKTLFIDGVEADDLIASYCIENKEQKNLIISSDKDFIQLQIHCKNLDQYCNKTKRFIRHDNPKHFLFEHILRGDSSDGIPNILSDIDVFINENKKQTKLYSKKIEDWMHEGLKQSLDDEGIKRYKLNRNLIDLTRIPPLIKLKIIKEFDLKFKQQKNKPILKYFVKHNMHSFIERTGEFRL